MSRLPLFATFTVFGAIAVCQLAAWAHSPDESAPAPTACTAPAAAEVVDLEQWQTWLPQLRTGVEVSLEAERTLAGGETMASPPVAVRTLGAVSATARQGVVDRLQALSAAVERDLEALAASPAAGTPTSRAEEAELLVESLRYEALRQQLLRGDYCTVAAGGSGPLLELAIPGTWIAMQPAIDHNEVREIVWFVREETVPRLVDALAYLDQMREVERVCAAAAFNALQLEERRALVARHRAAIASNDQAALRDLRRFIPFGVAMDAALVMHDS